MADTTRTSTTTPSPTHDEDPWSIAVKTVGGGFDDMDPKETENAPTTNSSGEKQFVVTVLPDDGVASLHDKIEASTGLKASQQRLIYRGRLITQQSMSEEVEAVERSAEEEKQATKIKDIAGLCDGQTIHLVKKRDTPAAESSAGPGGTSTESSSSTNANNNNRSSLESDILNGSSGNGGSGSLLAALLGLSSLSEDATNNNNNNNNATNNNNTNTTEDTARQRWGWRSSRLGQRSSRRPHYRLTAEDLEVPDPGSMEPVRQGLLTLHTLLPHATQDLAAASSSTLSNASASPTTPLYANREWYRGQWIDCRDTVNQWLEATICEIVDPEDILLPRRDERSSSSSSSSAVGVVSVLANDTAVSASDLEGRRRLLLEPCEPGDVHEEGDDLAGFRQRDTNTGIQLLLLHYNGWPHRWDEWIRSDSERIRPFRTRTRHPSMVRKTRTRTRTYFLVEQDYGICTTWWRHLLRISDILFCFLSFPFYVLQSSTTSPTPQSVYNEAPRTNIRDGDEAEDRSALLPELRRAVAVVNDLLTEIVPATTTSTGTTTTTTTTEEPPTAGYLPWIQTPNSRSGDEDSSSLPEMVRRGETSNILTPVDTDDDEDADDQQGTFGIAPRPEQPQYNRRQLQNLAALLDRLGRTLTDAAPHLASLAATLPEEPAAPAPVETTESEDVLARDLPNLEGGHHPPLGGLLSLWSRERRRQTMANEEANAEAGTGHNIDPDRYDYASGLVNTSRGEVRSGPRSRSQNDDVASLLGAYLAAASLGGMAGADDNDNNNDDDGNASGLGRLLRERGTGGGGGGGGGGGIDIHIHAVVTSPGIVPGGLGLAALGGGTPTLMGTALGGGTPTLGTTRNLFSSARDRTNRSTPTSSILRPSRHVSSSSASNSHENEEDTGLFAELYSETPAPVDPNGSPEPGERRASLPDLSGHHEDTTSDFLARINRSTSEGVSSTRRHRRSSSNRRERSSERRSSGWSRLFRRRARSRGSD
jgi:hypothetical protein